MFLFSADSKSCSEKQFQCFGNKRCIPLTWRCDGDNDCGKSDASDEANCTVTACNGTKFQCDNGRCAPISWRCDGIDDCGDNSDELGCSMFCFFFF